MFDKEKFIGKTVKDVILSKSSASLRLVFTDGSEVEINAQDNREDYPTLHVFTE